MYQHYYHYDVNLLYRSIERGRSTFNRILITLQDYAQQDGVYICIIVIITQSSC